MKKLGLLPRLILGIILGIVIGNLNLPSIVRILATFNSIFGNFLGFTIPPDHRWFHYPRDCRFG